MIAWVLPWVALAVTPEISVTAPDVDAAGLVAGVDARLGDDVAGWKVDVQPGTLPGHVHLRLVDPAGATVERDVELEGDDPEVRARQLASILSLLIEEQQLDAASKPTPPPDGPTRLEGWVGVVTRTAVNARRPVGPDPGLGITGGLWIPRAYLQPVVQLAWGRTVAKPLVLDGLRIGAGLYAGSAFGVGGRWWAGAGAIAHAMWAVARAEKRAAGWFSVTEAGGMIQLRGRWWTLGARLGLDIVLPPLSARSDDVRTRWDAARPAAALTFGVRLPPLPKSGPAEP